MTGYQIQCSLKSNFKSSKKLTVGSAKTTKKTIKKLKPGNTYYVRVRTYKTVNDKKIYSDWSPVKTVDIK